MLPYPKPKKQIKKKRKLSKPERQRLDAECMEYLKQIVRLRDGACVTPGKWCGGVLTASHWQKRGKTRIRYDLRNVNCQCSNCNGKHNNYTGPYDAFMLRKYGYDVCLELADSASLNEWKWTIPELRAIRDGLMIVCEQLKAEKNNG